MPPSKSDNEVKLNIPPHSIEAEQSVLGSLMLSSDAWDKVADVLIESDFYNRSHRLIYASILRLINANQSVDTVTVKDELSAHNQLEDAGGFPYLIELAKNTPSASNVSAYAHSIREKAVVRELIGVAHDIAEVGYNPEGRDSKEVLDLAETKVFEIAEKRTAAGEGPVDVKSVLKKTVARLDELVKQDAEVTGVSTGFDDLDKKTSGLQRSDLIIVAARPSMGKCIVADSLLLNPISGALETIEQMVENKQGAVLSVNDRFALGRAQASEFVNDGFKPVFKVTTALGRSIETTLTHPFLTGEGWLPLEKLNVGDKIAVPRSLAIFGEQSIPSAMLDVYADMLSTEPELKDAQHHSIVSEDVCTSSDVFVARQKTLSQTETQVKTQTRTQATSSTIPACIFSLPKEQLAYFLNKLLSKCASVEQTLDEGAYLELKSNRITMLKQLQHLLLRFGILAKISTSPQTASTLSVMHKHSLEILSKEIGLDETTLQTLAQASARATGLSVQSHDDSDCLPQSVISYILDKKGELTWKSLCEQSGFKQDLDGLKLDTLEQGKLNLAQLKVIAMLFDDAYLKDLAESELYWDDIVAISFEGYKQVYDLSVPHLHNFIAQDICVHNTTFAMNLCENAMMMQDKPVLVFSLEMPAEQIMMRMLASLSRVDQTKIRTAKLGDTDWVKLQQTMQNLHKKDNLFIDDSSGLTPMELRTRARKLARERGGISLIMVDYLQLMRVPSLSDNRTLEIAEISRSLKALAKELEVPVVALSQLNRGLEQRSDKRPINSDLRESGSIEQDADLIMFIYRDEVYHENSEYKGIAEIIIGKQRNGPIGTSRLTFQGQFSRFDNYAGPEFSDEY